MNSCDNCGIDTENESLTESVRAKADAARLREALEGRLPKRKENES